ncbi:MAG: DUF4293 family protein [Bacteroidota bacterium]
MLQRKQTIFLLLAGVCLAVFLALSAAWAVGPITALGWFATTAYVLGGMTAVVTFASILLYKQRAQQMRVVTLAQWLVLALVAVVVVAIGLTFQDAEAGPPAEWLLTYWSLTLPIVAYVFIWLAKRGVAADIALVKSMDRLR